jgi:aromatic-L-amino-acid decarboxylase
MRGLPAGTGGSQEDYAPRVAETTPLEPREDRPRLADREAVLALLSRYIADAWRSFDEPRPEEPPVDAALAARLREPLPEEGVAPEDALDDAVRVLDASVSPSRPLYLAYIGSSGLEVGVLGAALTATYDVNLAVTAGGAELVERQALEWVASFIGYPYSFGAFTSGGMTSNLTALLAARERALPGARRDGLGGRRGAIYCSDEAHHSIARAVEACGLGSANVRRLPLDDMRRMRPADLDAAIAADLDAGVTPVAVIANGGTTLTGAVDPLDAVADVCARHDVWLHVDGAYGLPAAATPTGAPLFGGLERADSLTLDAHKWLGVQKSCSLVLLRDGTALQDAFGHQERYMLHRDGELNAVDRTLEYSRPFRSAKLWLAFRIHGAAAFRHYLEHTLQLARRFEARVTDEPRFELLHRPQLSTVCFRHVPRDGMSALDLDAHNRDLAHAVQADGRVYLAPAVVDEHVCLRVCFVNFRTNEAEVDGILDILCEVAATLPVN